MDVLPSVQKQTYTFTDNEQKIIIHCLAFENTFREETKHITSELKKILLQEIISQMQWQEFYFDECVLTQNQKINGIVFVLKGDLTLESEETHISPSIKKQFHQIQLLTKLKYLTHQGDQVDETQSSLLKQQQQDAPSDNMSIKSSQISGGSQRYLIHPNLGGNEKTNYKAGELIGTFKHGIRQTEIWSVTQSQIAILKRQSYKFILRQQLKWMKQMIRILIRYFPFLPDDALNQIVCSLKRQVYARNHYLFQIGDSTDKLIFIQEGEVQLTKLEELPHLHEKHQIPEMVENLQKPSSISPPQNQIKKQKQNESQQLKKKQHQVMQESCFKIISSNEFFGYDHNIKNQRVYNAKALSMVVKSLEAEFSIHQIVQIIGRSQISDEKQSESVKILRQKRNQKNGQIIRSMVVSKVQMETVQDTVFKQEEVIIPVVKMEERITDPDRNISMSPEKLAVSQQNERQRKKQTSLHLLTENIKSQSPTGDLLPLINEKHIVRSEDKVKFEVNQNIMIDDVLTLEKKLKKKIFKNKDVRGISLDSPLIDIQYNPIMVEQNINQSHLYKIQKRQFEETSQIMQKYNYQQLAQMREQNPNKRIETIDELGQFIQQLQKNITDSLGPQPEYEEREYTSPLKGVSLVPNQDQLSRCFSLEDFKDQQKTGDVDVERAQIQKNPSTQTLVGNQVHGNDDIDKDKPNYLAAPIDNDDINNKSIAQDIEGGGSKEKELQIKKQKQKNLNENLNQLMYMEEIQILNKSFSQLDPELINRLAIETLTNQTIDLSYQQESQKFMPYKIKYHEIDYEKKNIKTIRQPSVLPYINLNADNEIDNLTQRNQLDIIRRLQPTKKAKLRSNRSQSTFDKSSINNAQSLNFDSELENKFKIHNIKSNNFENGLVNISSDAPITNARVLIMKKFPEIIVQNSSSNDYRKQISHFKSQNLLKI